MVPSLGFYSPPQALFHIPILTHLYSHASKQLAKLCFLSCVSESARHLPTHLNFTMPNELNICWRVSSDVFFSRNVLWSAKSGQGFHSLDFINTQDKPFSTPISWLVCQIPLLQCELLEDPACVFISLYPWHSHLLKYQMNEWKSLLAPPFLSMLRRYQGPTVRRHIGNVSRLKRMFISECLVTNNPEASVYSLRNDIFIWPFGT